ncbi:MAG: site-specific DNA-methyltransferase [Hyphomicrobiales bacterium]|nr:MAG: site-specific DNA-methyltransferase [Hyphomicrobiales bacterium]
MPLLHWLHKEKHVAAAEGAPYRLLTADDSLSAGDPETPNMLVQGDNLDALKALLPYYAGQVKCVFIDPPYNTKSAFEHYDDNLEHSQWLAIMYPRLVLLRELMAEDGSIWVTIDDNEAHYLKVMMDEIFGRSNFTASLAWHKRVSPANDAKYFSADHDHVLVYAASKPNWTPNRLSRSGQQLEYYKNPDDDPRGVWNSSAYTCAKSADERPNLFYSIRNPNTGEEIWPNRNRVWAYDRQTHERNVENNPIYWGKDGRGTMPRIKKFLAETKQIVPRSVWLHDEAGHNQESKIEIEKLFPRSPFGTPKPERLLKKILEIATNPGDLVLDSFLGSGTTAAVAHKMGRRYIGIEMGAHAVTHCAPRLKKVIEGEQGGISLAVGWQGGGGFRFYRLGPPIFDAEGRINPDIRFPQLAAHVWFCETRTALHGKKRGPLLGRHKGVAYYLLYNGVLGDKRPDGGNVLTGPVLKELPAHDGPKVIYGEACRIGPARLKQLGVAFKQTPYDVTAR